MLKPLPATDDPATFIMPAAAGAGYGVNAKAKNKELALKFVNFVMSPEGMKRVQQASRAACPSLPDTGSTVDPALDRADRRSSRTTGPCRSWTSSGPTPRCSRPCSAGLQEIFSGQSTPDKVLAAMDADYKAGEG